MAKETRGSLSPVLLIGAAGLAVYFLLLRPQQAGAALYPSAAYPYGGGTAPYGSQAWFDPYTAPLAGTPTTPTSTTGKVAGAVAGGIAALAGAAKAVSGLFGGGAAAAGATGTVGAVTPVLAAEPTVTLVGGGTAAAAPEAAGIATATLSPIVAAAAGLAAVAGVVIAGQIGLKQDIADFKSEWTENIRPELDRPIAERIAYIQQTGYTSHYYITKSVAWQAIANLGYVGLYDYPSTIEGLQPILQSAGAGGRDRAMREGLWSTQTPGSDLTYDLNALGLDLALRWGHLPSNAELQESVYQLARQSWTYSFTAPSPTGAVPQVGAGGQILTPTGAPTQTFQLSMGDFGR